MIALWRANLHQLRMKAAIVRRDELSELHYIAPMANLHSIFRHGILSKRRSVRITHESIAMQEIQDRRAKIVVPNGRSLHDYANLYVCARNPMLYRLANRHLDLCVLQVSTDVLDLAGVVVTDRNASSDYVRFAAGAGGLSIVDREVTFARYWTHPDQAVQWHRKSAKCAEVLVPDKVDPRFIMGAYVSCQPTMAKLNELETSIRVSVDSDIFFR